MQTAVKTGTSTDYRDAWAVGFDAQYAVGIWMGNLDQTPMDGVTGSTGPALTLRGIFAELSRLRDTRALPLSPALERHTVCMQEAPDRPCHERQEYFVAGTAPSGKALAPPPPKRELVQPTPNLRLAIDPRVPRDLQQFHFRVAGLKEGERVRWQLNGQVLGESDGSYAWKLVRGRHVLQATILGEGETALPEVTFYVK